MRFIFRRALPALLLLLTVGAGWVCGQAGTKQKIKTARDLYKRSGASAIPELRGYLKEDDPEVRREATRLIVEAGTPASLDALLEASQDADAEVQGRAVEGLVNVYLPGYANRGNLFGRTGRNLKGRFTDTSDQVIEPYVVPRAEVAGAVQRLIDSGASTEVKASAARAAGVLRAKTAVPMLLEAARSKESALIGEALVALQKIGDPSAAPGIAFLLQDLNERVQVSAIETSGLLRNRSALPGLREALTRARTEKVRAAALSAIGMLPDEASRPLYDTYLADRSDDLRASAAEGLGRLRKPEADRARLLAAFEAETKMKPRLAMAFAAVMLGERAATELAPLTYLVNSLNSTSWRGVAFAYLEELTRDKELRTSLYGGMPQRTRAEKTDLAAILARSGDAETAPVLEALARDPDTAVAQAAARALLNLRTRIQ